MELYIHIPFCIRKCSYCAFTSFAGCACEEMAQYTNEILREADQRIPFISEPIKTVYVGGGTPSLLPAHLLKQLFLSLRKKLPFSPDPEFTVEANPGTVSEEWLDTALFCGANRISFGVQAVQDHLLQILGRIHSFDQVIQSVDSARKRGFQNISIDLIFGIPGQTMPDWQATLRDAISLQPAHISAYGLIPEEGTPLNEALNKNSLSLPDPELERDMYDSAIQILEDAGFHQYEISNFAQPGSECRHNIGYWDQIPYIGLGLSAASMIRLPSNQEDIFSFRWNNPSTFKDYYTLIEHPELFDSMKEKVSRQEARFETLMLALRMTGGMNRNRFTELHGDVPEHWFGPVLNRMEKLGLMEMKDNSWRLTRRGMDIQNSVLVEFME